MSAMKVDSRGWFREDDPDYSASKCVHEWPVFGIPVTADPVNAYATLLQGRTPDAFTDDELTKIFEKPVILDGQALEVLWERGFGEKTGVRIKAAQYGGSEKLVSSPYAGEFAGSTRSAIYGKAYDLEPVADGVEVLAYTVRPYGAADQLCAAKYGNVVTLGYNPYQFTGTPGHMKLMQELEKVE